MSKSKYETRYRVIGFSTFWHPAFNCYVEVGEDYNPGFGLEGGRTESQMAYYCDSKQMETYQAVAGTPHVVHRKEDTSHWDAEKEEHVPEINYSDARKQWVGETVFVERYVAPAAQETSTVKE